MRVRMAKRGEHANGGPRLCSGFSSHHMHTFQTISWCMSSSAQATKAQARKNTISHSLSRAAYKDRATEMICDSGWHVRKRLARHWQLTLKSTNTHKELLKACPSVAQGRQHEGKGDAAVPGRQERGVPNPRRRHDTHTLRVSVRPSHAHHGLARLKSGVCGDGC